jgi:hypothetical protein
VIQAPALEHRLEARRLNTGNLERVQDRVWAHLDERLTKPFFFRVDRHACREDGLVERE